MNLRRALIGSLLVAIVIAARAAAASDPQSQPLTVRSASLRQSGQDLLWQVQFTQPFSPSALQSEGGAVCLLTERSANGSVAGQVCVLPPAHPKGSTRLAYAPVTSSGPGSSHVIAATVKRPNDEALTAEFLPTAVKVGYRPLRWQVISTLRPPACTPPAGASQCSTVFPATPTLTKLHTPRLVGCVPRGSSLVYGGSSHKHDIALTFDDGPWFQPPPSAFLRVLERAHVPATFFEIGDQISTYDHNGAFERRMLKEGDMIGDHSWSHPDVAALPASGQRAQLLSAAAAIRHATRGFRPCLWRPPYGDISPSLISLARSLGFLTIMWDVDPRDWSLPGTAAIYENVVSNAHNGAIVIQHFGGGPRYETVAALPEEIKTLRRRGYHFVTVAQMLGLRLIYK